MSPTLRRWVLSGKPASQKAGKKHLFLRSLFRTIQITDFPKAKIGRRIRYKYLPRYLVQLGYIIFLA
jgi:hypothetical protein